jgi:hypothetical protein
MTRRVVDTTWQAAGDLDDETATVSIELEGHQVIELSSSPPEVRK